MKGQYDLSTVGGTYQLAGAGAASIDAPGGSIANAINARGIRVKINLTGAPGGTTPTMTVTIQGVDVPSGQKWTLLQSAALNAQGFVVLEVFPGATPAANLTANDELPSDFNVHVAFGGTNPSFTGSISLELLP